MRGEKSGESDEGCMEGGEGCGVRGGKRGEGREAPAEAAFLAAAEVALVLSVPATEQRNELQE